MKRFSLLLMIFLLLLFTACSSAEATESIDDSYEIVEEDKNEDLTENADTDILDDYTNSDSLDDDTNSDNLADDTSSDSLDNNTDNSEIDVDLTTMSATMVFAEVYNMLVSPDYYVGKTVKMEGYLSIYQDPTTEKIYFAVVIEDATACCMQGIEFTLTDDYTYPDDYPDFWETVTVIGEFETYFEGESQYVQLKDAYWG